MNECIRCVKPFPQQVDATETINDPFVTSEQLRVGLMIFVVRDFDTSRSVLKLVNNRKRHSGDGSELPGKRRLSATGITEYRNSLHAAQRAR
jgi:hypothetical protein